MNLKEKQKVFDKLGIGSIALVEKWLLRNEIPIKKETLQRITDDQGKTLAFKAELDMISDQKTGILNGAVTEVIVKLKEDSF
ncbi:MAG: hypothetical protein K0B37_17790 [Bacteroidales bacterium]|nr:hypothetical protein [Bacteroidales bacterium]